MSRSTRQHTDAELPPIDTGHPCTSYSGGHQVHWIQALHSGRPGAADAEWTGVVLGVADGLLSVRTDTGLVLRYRNHDLARFEQLRRAGGDRVSGNTRFAVVRVGEAVFSVARDTGQPLEACPTEELPAAAGRVHQRTTM